MKSAYVLALLAATASLAGCSAGPPWDDPFEQYARRSHTVTFSAGNAKEANAAIQVIDPWPAYAWDTRIPGNGQRMAEAEERYQDVSKLSKAPRPIAPTFGTNIGIAGGTSPAP
jgi:hypothetical protein